MKGKKLMSNIMCDFRSCFLNQHSRFSDSLMKAPMVLNKWNKLKCYTNYFWQYGNVFIILLYFYILSSSYYC